MRTETLSRFLAAVERRKALVGLDESPEGVEGRRNKGARRSAAKRALIKSTERRARSANVEPIRSFA